MTTALVINFIAGMLVFATVLGMLVWAIASERTPGLRRDRQSVVAAPRLATITADARA
jgi:hypothetical protein